jgi:hypothetical protein
VQISTLYKSFACVLNAVESKESNCTLFGSNNSLQVLPVFLANQALPKTAEAIFLDPVEEFFTKLWRNSSRDVVFNFIIEENVGQLPNETFIASLERGPSRRLSE